MAENYEEDPRQCWATPPEFFSWVDRMFGPFDLDVCADSENKKCENYISRERDGLSTPWVVEGRSGAKCWCNPGFANVGPWLEKAHQEAKAGNAHTFVLTHAGISTAWFDKYIHRAHRVYAIRPRINFVPKGAVKASSNPKDSLLWEFRPGSDSRLVIDLLDPWRAIGG
jgi:phage N-6-adenine-methyltransferase